MDVTLIVFAANKARDAWNPRRLVAGENWIVLSNELENIFASYVLFQIKIRLENETKET